VRFHPATARKNHLCGDLRLVGEAEIMPPSRFAAVFICDLCAPTGLLRRIGSAAEEAQDVLWP
jgi:hypothetical protein